MFVVLQLSNYVLKNVRFMRPFFNFHRFPHHWDSYDRCGGILPDCCQIVDSESLRPCV